MAVKKPTHYKIDMEFGNFAEFHAAKMTEIGVLRLYPM
jgi:hypothetical protein